MEERRDPSEGTAEVHTHIGVRPAGDRAGTGAEADPLQREGSGPFGDFAADASDEDFRQRARHLLAGSRQRARSAIEDAEQRLDDRTGVLRLIREHPLPAVGIAFAVGFALAGKSDPETRLGQLKKRVRGAAATAAAAALAEEARNLVGSEGGLASLLELVLDRIREPVEEWT